MTIRYSCEKCGSVLKIKDDRAGKEGHCPKCKATFVVPSPEPAAVAASVSATESAKPGPTVKARPAVPAAAAVAEPAPAVEDADFDPVAFLMTDKKDEKPKGAVAGKAPRSDGDSADMRIRTDGPAAYRASEEPDERVGGPRRPNRVEEEEAAEARANRKPKKSAPPSAAQTADEMLRVNASTNAKELLTKTMEESRIRAAQMPEERRKPGVDYKETAKELLLRFAPYTVGFVLLIVCLYAFSNYMLGPSAELPPLGYVSGTVTKEGKPLDGAMVTFIPVDTSANASTAISDKEGYYELKYIEGVPGAVLGKNKVEVSLIGPNGREVVPARTPYGLGSNEIETVQEGSQVIDIKIP